MKSSYDKILVLLKVLIHFIVLLLILTGSNYSCEIKDKDSVNSCLHFGFKATQSETCQGSTFVVTAKGSERTLFLLCPWGGGVIISSFVGCLAALLCVLIIISRKIKRRFFSQNCVALTSLFTFLLLIIATVFMLTEIYNSAKKCQIFENELRGKDFTGKCSNKIFGVTFILSLVGVLLFGYDAIQGLYNYKSHKKNSISDYERKNEYYKKLEIERMSTL